MVSVRHVLLGNTKIRNSDVGGIKMVKAVVGANWGDEGKGKITDMLAERADIIIRFQGGANAGHTIINDYGKFRRIL